MVASSSFFLANISSTLSSSRPKAGRAYIETQTGQLLCSDYDDVGNLKRM